MSQELEGKVVKGKIIKVQEDKGYGFIVTPELRFTRVFFHWSGLVQDTLNFADLKKGMEVEFTLHKATESWKAIKIKVMNHEN